MTQNIKYTFSKLAAPARRALEAQNICEVADLTGYTEKEIMALHGIGKNAMTLLKQMLKDEDLSFKS